MVRVASSTPSPVYSMCAFDVSPSSSSSKVAIVPPNAMVAGVKLRGAWPTWNPVEKSVVDHCCPVNSGPSRDEVRVTWPRVCCVIRPVAAS
jgi:hypothetical protein